MAITRLPPEALRGLVSIQAVTPNRLKMVARDIQGRFTSVQNELNTTWRLLATRHYFDPAREALQVGIATPGREQRPTRRLERAMRRETEMITLKPAGGGIIIDPEEWLDSAQAGVRDYWRAIEFGHPGVVFYPHRRILGVFMPSGTPPGDSLRTDAEFRIGGRGAGLLMRTRPFGGYAFLQAGAQAFRDAVTGPAVRAELIRVFRDSGLPVSDIPRSGVRRVVFPV